MRAVFAFACAAVLVALFFVASVAAIDEKQIKCKVCDRAIAHIWEQGVKLRTHCKTHGTDARCDISNLHLHGIEQMVHEVCDDLPRTHQALLESDFEMIAHDDPQHEPEIIDAIKKACVRWVHQEHSVPAVTRLIFANLDAGKSTRTIMHALQQRFCDAACRKDAPADEPTSGDL
eukprot:CAMPEP_0174856676 /NCGR_PEP_ID=MMETSP1114-20130205/36162_1 /TAXON_ID=312471 /ORGANISM="Neobodo designis, Strain CCAP 1951/1" /LENGTH=174 /DNA_ID=CAMNT_0016091481 /DNA_START=44 /DNA_END=568 /DNA_ORIENTATION=-